MIRRKLKTAAQRRQLEQREDWANSFGRCWGCGKFLLGRYGTVWVEYASQIHEIVPKSQTADWCDPRNLSLFCNLCHPNGADGDGQLTIGMVLTLKLLLDPAHFDLDWIRGHATRKGMSPEPLPPRCDWLFSYDALVQRNP